MAFAPEKASDYLQREAFGSEVNRSTPPTEHIQTEPGVQDLNTRLMAHMLGLDIPGIEPSTSYYPGYEWWPRNGQGQGGSQPLSPVAPGPIDANTLPPPMNMADMFGPAGEEWLQPNGAAAGMQYPYNYNQYGL